MKNLFIEQPNDDIIIELEHLYSIANGFINIGIEDYHSTISGANNVIILKGKGTGSNRVSNALEDAVLHSCKTAAEYDLFSADKVIIKLFYPKENQLMLEEASGILDFAEMFTSKPTFIWGISEMENIQDNVIAFIVASNLAKK